MARYRQVDPSHLLPPDPNLKVEKKNSFFNKEKYGLILLQFA